MAEVRRAAAPIASVQGAKFLIVEARFYDNIADLLLKGARAVLEQAQAQIEVITVPGSLEVPTAIRMAYDRVAYAGVVALGCVIRGETYHFELVANESARGLMEIASKELLPLGNGILTTENEAQAIARADPAQGDKGGDAARAALILYHLKQRR